MNRLALFDIDGTLTRGITLHYQAFCYAVHKVTGRKIKNDDKGYMGWVDKAILADLLGKDASSEQLELAMHLSGLFYRERVGSDDLELLPHVYELLKNLTKKGILLGVVSGNVKEIAQAKLNNLGIAGFFRVGAFGSERRDRKDLIPIAIQRAAKTTGKSFDRVVLVGDTPFDIRAARMNDIEVIAVSHGYHNASDLVNADLLVKDFSDIQKIVDFIEND
jgi:phosphoglycolate phosphatase-like HAD superfamily hydrolase